MSEKFFPYLRLLRQAYRIQAQYFLRERQRLPSFGDMIGDRREKATMLGFGDGTSIYDSALVLGDVSVGAHTWIGPGVVLDGSGKLEIGSWCSISAGVQIYTHDSVAWALSGGEKNYVHSPTRIGDNVYIGPCSVIQAGCVIGHHCVIGAGSFVRRDIPPWFMACGCPARVVGRIVLDDSPKGWTLEREGAGQ